MSMTREEAKIFLLQLNTDKQLNKSEHEALRIAIKGLEQEPTDDATLKDIFCMGCEYKEQEPCEDCISRQAVIDVIERWLKCSDYNEAERHIMKAVQSVLYDSPPVTPQPKTGHWIPVSERLPEEPGEYLITWTGILGEHSTKRSKPLMAIAEYEIYEPENYEDWITTGDEFEYYRDIKVSAWMPLPPSYQGRK